MDTNMASEPVQAASTSSVARVTAQLPTELWDKILDDDSSDHLEYSKLRELWILRAVCTQFRDIIDDRFQKEVVTKLVLCYQVKVGRFHLEKFCCHFRFHCFMDEEYRVLVLCHPSPFVPGSEGDPHEGFPWAPGSKTEYRQVFPQVFSQVYVEERGTIEPSFPHHLRATAEAERAVSVLHGVRPGDKVMVCYHWRDLMKLYFKQEQAERRHIARRQSLPVHPDTPVGSYLDVEEWVQSV